jgi:hypothetical protein
VYVLRINVNRAKVYHPKVLEENQNIQLLFSYIKEMEGKNFQGIAWKRREIL